MKKVLSLILAVCLLVALAACNNKSDSGKKSSGSELRPGKEYSARNYADFTLRKIYSTQKLTAPLGSSYYDNNNAGEIYVDVLLELTNTGKESIRCNEVVVASVVGGDGDTYTDAFYVVETADHSGLRQYEDIAPEETVRLHCAVSVPEDETDLTVKLELNGKRFSCDYTLGQVLSDATALQVGQTIGDEAHALLRFNGIEHTDRLDPSDTSGVYRYYEVDDPDNTYLVVKFDVANNGAEEFYIEDLVGVKATYMDQYNYTGFLVVEDDGGAGFSSYNGILPLDVGHGFCLIEVPKTVVGNQVTVTVFFDGNEYTYTEN